MQDEQDRPPDTPEDELSDSQTTEIADQQNYYTCREVATELGYSRAYIGRLCSKGRFKGAIRIVGGQWKIPAATIAKLRLEGLKPTRKPQQPQQKQPIILDQETVNRIGAGTNDLDATPPSAAPGPGPAKKKKRIYPLWPLTFIYTEVDE